jgi:prepilin-type N-terminal cleavage/methylation domain-containing protein
MHARGFSLVELLVTIAIAAVLLSLGLGSVTSMIASSRTRGAAESVLSGLQMARAEAIQRNTPMRFQLVTSMDSACASNTAAAAASMLWVVSQTDQGLRGLVSNKCHAMPWLPPDQMDPCTPDPGSCPASGVQPANCRPAVNVSTASTSACSADPWIAFKSTSTVTTEVKVEASTILCDPDPPNVPPDCALSPASVVTFGPIGQVLANTPDGAAVMGYIRFSYPTQADAKTWGIRINTTNGGVKLCDPALVAGAPLACS